MKTIACDAGIKTPRDLLPLEEYDWLVQTIHEGSLDSKAFSRALEALRFRWRANYVALIVRIPGMEGPALMLLVGDVNTSGKLSYMPYQRSTVFSGCPADKVFTQEDLMSEEEWQRCEYYLDHCKDADVYHLMGADISLPDGGVVRFRATRPHGAPAFSEEDRALCSMLLPHFRCSLRIHNELGRSESLGSLYAQAINRLSVAAIVLDERGCVLELNEVAEELLAKGDGLKVVGSRLEASYPSDNSKLHKRIQKVFEAQSKGELLLPTLLPIARPSGEVSLGVVVEPIPEQSWAEAKGQPALVLYVRDAVGKPQVSNVAAMRLFEFTPAETALALELANGLSLEEAAENLGIMRNTARAHLRAIFSKTGVRRQAELVRVILNSIVTLGRDAVRPLESNDVQVPQPALRPLRK
ncbi:helix-turn-helix transcriptional regulator [Proteobacteria bacterium 005FR1]|nr:helix-turn-helix transcriptional regulator [Proteobacteria bacterium 005FR1]